MSHIVTIETEVRDRAAVEAACRRLGLAAPEPGTHRLYGGQAATGLAVRLPGWRYPAVFDMATGKAAFDNFGGAWGSPAELDRFRQAYAVEKAKIEARRSGYSATESVLADGSIRVAILV